MAWSEVVTEVVGNPGRKGAKSMARKLTAKQIKFFGTKRQKAALAAKRSRSAKRSSSKSKARSKKTHRPRTAANPGPEALVLTLGNSARKGRTMATSSKKKKKSGAHAHRKNAGGGGKRKKVMQFKRRRTQRNPGALGSPMDWITGGAGVLAGVVGTRALPQVILSDKNTGPVGYFANAVTAAGLGWVAHLVFPRNRILTASVLAGGFAAVIARIIGDYTSYGKYLSLTGVGDYMVSNFVSPQRLVNPGGAMMEVPAGWGAVPPALVMASSGVDPADLASTGVDLGRRAGVC